MNWVSSFIKIILTTYKIFNLDITAKDDNKEWPYRKLIIGLSGSGQANYLLNDCNWTRTHNHLVHKRTLNHLAKKTTKTTT